MSATRCQVVLSTRSACGVELPRAALVEQHDAVLRRIVETAHLRTAAAARAAVQQHDRFAVGIAALLVIQRMAVVDAQRAAVVGLDLGIQGAHRGGSQGYACSLSPRAPAAQADAVARLEVLRGCDIHEARLRQQRTHGIALVAGRVRAAASRRRPDVRMHRGRSCGSRRGHRPPTPVRCAARSAGRPARDADRRRRRRADCSRSGRNVRPRAARASRRRGSRHWRCRAPWRWRARPPARPRCGRWRPRACAAVRRRSRARSRRCRCRGRRCMRAHRRGCARARVRPAVRFPGAGSAYPG